jgi:hypothetical protein
VSEIERHLDELFDRMAGQGAAGRRALIETEDHLRAAAADAMAQGLPADQAEHEAVTRFGSPGMVARKMHSAHGAGRRNQASSPGRLLPAACIRLARGGPWLRIRGPLAPGLAGFAAPWTGPN